MNPEPKLRTSADANATGLNRVLQNSTLYLIGNVASRALGFLAIPFYTRFLSADQYGIIELIELSTQVVAITFGLQSIGLALTRTYHEQKAEKDAAAVVSTGLITTAVLSAMIAVAAIMAANPLSQAVFHSTARASLFRAAFSALFFSNLIEVILVYERIRERAKFYLIYSLVGLFAMLSLNIYFIGFLRIGVWGFIASKLVVSVVSCGYLLWRSFREVGWSWRPNYVREFIRFGAPLIVSGASYFAIHFSDRFFLTSAVSLAELGRYALSYRFAFLISILVGDSFGKSWNVTFYRYAEESGWREQFARVLLYLTFVLCLAAVAIALFSPELLYVMAPPSYYPPFLLIPILVFSYVFRELGDFFRNVLLIDKRSGQVGKIAFIGALLNTGLNFAFIPRYGIYGAAAATISTWFAYFVICWIAANRQHHIPISIRAIAQILVLSAGVFVLARALRVPFYPVQVILDFVWVLLFIALCLILYFPQREREAIWLGAATLISRYLLSIPLRVRDTAKEPGVLLISYFYPPENTSGAARPGRFRKYLAQHGHEVTVVSRAAPDLNSADPTVIRVPLKEQAPAAVRRMSRLLGIVQRVLFAYDDRLPWAPHAFAAGAAALRRDPDQVLLSTSPPVATHFCALLLKRHYRVPWIADFRDPYSGNPFRSARRASWLDPFLEILIMENADAVIANTDAVAALWRKRYPKLAHKITVIWNGFDPDDRILPVPGDYRPRRTLTHVGSLYGGRRPQPVLDSLSRLCQSGALSPRDFELRLVGPLQDGAVSSTDDHCRYLADNGSLHIEANLLPQATARAEIVRADLLLLLDINGQNAGLQVPAKLFDYIRVCRPILAFTPADSATEHVLSMSGIDCVCVRPTDSSAETDRKVAEFMQRRFPLQRPAAGFLNEFNVRSQTAVLARIISSVSGALDRDDLSLAAGSRAF